MLRVEIAKKSKNTHPSSQIESNVLNGPFQQVFSGSSSGTEIFHTPRVSRRRRNKTVADNTCCLCLRPPPLSVIARAISVLVNQDRRTNYVLIHPATPYPTLPRPSLYASTTTRLWRDRKVPYILLRGDHARCHPVWGRHLRFCPVIVVLWKTWLNIFSCVDLHLLLLCITFTLSVSFVKFCIRSPQSSSELVVNKQVFWKFF